MRAILAISIIATGALAAVPADAAWQYTRWGMTSEQVIKASKGIAQPETNGRSVGGDTVKITAPYQSGQFSFTAKFWFDQNDKLTEVILDMTAGDPNALIGSLRSKYGEPVNHTPGFIEAYMWRTDKDQIGCMTSGGKTSLSYSPRIRNDAKGL